MLNFDWERKTGEAREDPRSTEELIQQALAYEAESHEDDDLSYNEPLLVLQYRATAEVFDAASQLLRSEIPKERSLGADILGQLGIPKRAFPEQSLAVLLPVLKTETDIQVLGDICIALGHLGHRKAIGPLARLRKHPDEYVRYGVVIGLLTYEDRRAIAALIELSRDTDEDVRDWATFGLGTQIDKDTEEIRDALADRLTDEHSDTRHEAIMGLARRRDLRALDPLISELSGDPQEITLLTLEAAAEFKDERLCPYLLSLRKRWEGDDDSHTRRLTEALQECGCGHETKEDTT